jgi:hypothetical protein
MVVHGRMIVVSVHPGFVIASKLKAKDYSHIRAAKPCHEMSISDA